MISERKLAANRLNAAKSTGPRTDEGKAASARNAITHGFSAQTCAGVVLGGEDQIEFNAFADAAMRDLKPIGIIQREVAGHIVQILWKLRRVPRIEQEMTKQALAQRPPRERATMTAVQVFGQILTTYTSENCCAQLEQYRQRLQRSLHQAMRELRRLREETGGEEEADDLCVAESVCEPSPGTPGEGRVRAASESEDDVAVVRRPSPQPSPGVPGEGEMASIASGQNEPTDQRNAWPSLILHEAQEQSPMTSSSPGPE
jgi:hypothetical protein